MSGPEGSTAEKQALARKLFAGAYDRLWRRSAQRKNSEQLTVTLDDVRKAFAETVDAIGSSSFLPASSDETPGP